MAPEYAISRVKSRKSYFSDTQSGKAGTKISSHGWNILALSARILTGCSLHGHRFIQNFFFRNLNYYSLSEYLARLLFSGMDHNPALVKNCQNLIHS